MAKRRGTVIYRCVFAISLDVGMPIFPTSYLAEMTLHHPEEPFQFIIGAGDGMVIAMEKSSLPMLECYGSVFLHRAPKGIGSIVGELIEPRPDQCLSVLGRDDGAIRIKQRRHLS